jgi:hypothetical protein
MPGPVLWGPNNTANNLQNQELLASGALLAWNGPKNYITYNNFENQLTTGWSLGTVGTLTNGLPTGTPTFGSGASGTQSISIVTSGQLAGLASLSYANSAATTQGNMLASQAYSIDAEDQAKVLTFKFYYSVPVGASTANFSGTSSNSFAVAFWDVTNSSWLSQTANFGMSQSTGSGYCTGTFQTNSNTASIRMVIYNANATTGACTLYLDDFFCGPQTAPFGPALTDWQSYTPTIGAGAGTVSNVAFQWRRDGDTMEVLGTFTAGTTAASLVSISLPLGTINTGKITIANTTSAAGQAVGNFYVNGTSASNSDGPMVTALGTSTSLVYVGGLVNSATMLTPANGTTVLVSSGVVSINFRVPISGWSSNLNMSSDTDTRVIAANATGSSTSTSSGSFTTVAFTSTSFDTAGAMGTSTYTVPVSGFYSITGILKWPSYSVGYNAAAINQNGTQSDLVCYAYNGGTASTGTMVSGTLKCTAGDTLNLTAYQGSGSAVGLAGATLSISRLSGPAVVAATESVNGRYYSSTSAITGADATVTFVTKSRDTHNAYASGTLTIPVSGMYQFNAALAITETSGTNALSFYQNGNQVSQTKTSASLSGVAPLVLADAFPCLAGDLITVKASSTGTSPSISASNVLNYFSWSRSGN